MLVYELISFKRREPTKCDVEVRTSIVSDAQVNIANPATDFYLRTVGPYDFIHSGVDGDLAEVSKQLKEDFARKTQNLQQSYRDTARWLANETRLRFANAPSVIDKRLSVEVERAVCTLESARP